MTKLLQAALMVPSLPGMRIPLARGRIAAAKWRICQALEEAETDDEADCALWEFTTDFRVVLAGLAVAADAHPTNSEALERLRAANQEAREAAGSGVVWAAPAAPISIPVLRRCHRAAVEAACDVFTPRFLRDLFTGSQRTVIGLLALQAAPARAAAICAFIEEALTDYEAAVSTYRDSASRQRELDVSAALQGRFARLTSEAESRLDEADDQGLVTIPFFRTEDEAMWQADLELGRKSSGAE